MARHLRNLEHIRATKGKNLPVLYAGDIFHRWDAPPELINFAISHLPKGWAVPGQHDLPHHRYEDIGKSAYHTLCQAGVLTNVRPGIDHQIGDEVYAFGFPWGTKITPPHEILTAAKEDAVYVALCHAYIWTEGACHPEAGPEDRWDTFREKLKGYDCAVFGDNHVPFTAARAKVGECEIYNCGAFIARARNEQVFARSVGVVYSDGTVSRVPLDTTEDRWLDEDTPAEAETPVGYEDLVKELSSLAGEALDFGFALARTLDRHGAGPDVRALIEKARRGERGP